MDRRSFLVGAAASVAPALGAVQMPGQEGHRLLREQARYVPLINELRKISPPDELTRDVFSQVLALAGDEDGAFAQAPVRRTPPFDLAGCHVEDALETIVRAAKGRRIVILNEAHNVSRCRAFAQTAALRLADEGFSIFAAETFMPPVEAVTSDTSITPEMGWYVADPVYRAATARGPTNLARRATMAPTFGSGG